MQYMNGGKLKKGKKKNLEDNYPKMTDQLIETPRPENYRCPRFSKND